VLYPSLDNPIVVSLPGGKFRIDYIPGSGPNFGSQASVAIDDEVVFMSYPRVSPRSGGNVIGPRIVMPEGWNPSDFNHGYLCSTEHRDRVYWRADTPTGGAYRIPAETWWGVESSSSEALPRIFGPGPAAPDDSYSTQHGALRHRTGRRLQQ